MITLLIYLAIFGFVIWLITLIPMPDLIRKIIIGIAVLLLVLWVLNLFQGPAPLVTFPRLR